MSFLQVNALVCVVALAAAVAAAGCSATGGEGSGTECEGALLCTSALTVWPDSVRVTAGDGPADIYRVGREGITAPSHGKGYVGNMPPAGDMLYTSPSRVGTALFAGWGADTATVAIPTLAGILAGPGEAMARLRQLVGRDGCVLPAGYPLEGVDASWGMAAWRVYCATADRRWLRESLRTLTATWLKARRIQPLPGSGLPGYITATPGATPVWLDGADLAACRSLRAAVSALEDALAAALMAAELGHESTAALWTARAAGLREDINDTFWIPSRQTYCGYTYGMFYPLPSPVADIRAQAACITSGTATAAMAAAVLGRMPLLARGYPSLYPLLQGCEPECGPQTQAAVAIAASRVGNGDVMTAAAAALWATALGQSGSGAAKLWRNTVVEGLMGISVAPGELNVAPVVPETMPGPHVLGGLRWHGATVDIQVHGTGHRIAAVMLDSVPVDRAAIPSSLTGHHSMHITLAGNSICTGGGTAVLTETKPVHLLPSPAWQWSATAPGQASLTWPEGVDGGELWLNGVLAQCVTGETLRLPDDTASAGDSTVTVVALTPAFSGTPGGFSPREHVVRWPGSVIHIPSTSITPRRPPLHLIKHKPTAARFIELAPRHNTRLTFYVQAPSGGEWWVQAVYANASGRTALRTLEGPDGLHCGTLVCPPVVSGNWVATARSRAVAVKLKQGVNKLSLTYLDGTLLLHDFYLMKK